MEEELEASRNIIKILKKKNKKVTEEVRDLQNE